jgi:hypothetical protein
MPGCGCDFADIFFWTMFRFEETVRREEQSVSQERSGNVELIYLRRLTFISSFFFLSFFEGGTREGWGRLTPFSLTNNLFKIVEFIKSKINTRTGSSTSGRESDHGRVWGCS